MQSVVAITNYSKLSCNIREVQQRFTAGFSDMLQTMTCYVFFCRNNEKKKLQMVKTSMWPAACASCSKMKMQEIQPTTSRISLAKHILIHQFLLTKLNSAADMTTLLIKRTNNKASYAIGEFCLSWHEKICKEQAITNIIVLCNVPFYYWFTCTICQEGLWLTKW